MDKRMAVGLTTVLVLAAVVGTARQVIYHRAQQGGFEPQPPGVTRPSDFGMRFDSVTIRSGARQLDAWWIPADAPDSGAVVLFHGNAENTSNWLAATRLLHGHHLSVLLFDYSGYGRSTGTASIEAAIEDGVSALREFRRLAPAREPRTGIGLSLGAAVLMEANSRYPGAVDRVTLLEPFASGRETAVYLGMLPSWLALLMPDVLDNVRLARTLRLPLLVVHSREDRKFPVAFAREIVAAASGPSQIVVLSGFAHAAAWKDPSESYWSTTVAFATADAAGRR